MPWRLLQDTVQELERDKDLLKKKYDEVHHLNLQLKEKIDQLMALPETCMAALTTVDIKGLLQVTLNILIRFAKLDRAGFFCSMRKRIIWKFTAELALISNCMKK
jgi:hypothetical protein